MLRSIVILVSIFAVHFALASDKLLKLDLVGPAKYTKLQSMFGQDFLNRYGDSIAEKVESLDLKDLALRWKDADEVTRAGILDEINVIREDLSKRLENIVPRKQLRVSLVKTLVSENDMRTISERIEAEDKAKVEAERSAAEKAKQDAIAAAEKAKADAIVAAQQKQAELVEQQKQQAEEQHVQGHQGEYKTLHDALIQAKLQRKSLDEKIAKSQSQHESEQGARPEFISQIGERQNEQFLGTVARGRQARADQQAALDAQDKGHPVPGTTVSDKTLATMGAFLQWMTPVDGDSGEWIDYRAKAGLSLGTGAGIILINQTLKKKNVAFQKSKTFKALKLGGYALAVYGLVTSTGSYFRGKARADRVRSFMNSEAYQKMLETYQKAMGDEEGKLMASRILNGFIAQGELMGNLNMFLPPEDRDQVGKLIADERAAVEKLLPPGFIDNQEHRRRIVDKIAAIRAYLKLQSRDVNLGDEEVIEYERILKEMEQELAKAASERSGNFQGQLVRQGLFGKDSWQELQQNRNKADQEVKRLEAEVAKQEEELQRHGVAPVIPVSNESTHQVRPVRGARIIER